MCCSHLKSDSKPQAMFSADRLEVKKLDKLPTSCHSPIFEKCLKIGVIDNKTREHEVTRFESRSCIVGNTAIEFIIMTELNWWPCLRVRETCIGDACPS